MIIDKLVNAIKEKNAAVVVGLDPMPAYIPEELLEAAKDKYSNQEDIIEETLFSYNKELIDRLYQYIPAVKPQIAMYEQFGIGGLKAYGRTVDYAHEKGLIVIGDVKRGDIGSTSGAYSSAHIGGCSFGGMEFKGFNADFATVNPYFGIDGVQPFIDDCKKHDKGIFVLVKTSNPSSGDFQDLTCAGMELYKRVALKTVEWGKQVMSERYSAVGAVVGATYPREAAQLRDLMPNTFILVPGYGAQGATAKDLKPFFNSDGTGAIVNSSRGIIAAYKKDKYSNMNFASAAESAVKDMISDINSIF